MTLGRFVYLIGLRRSFGVRGDNAPHFHFGQWAVGAGIFRKGFPYRTMRRHYFGGIFGSFADACFGTGRCQLMFRLWRFGIAVQQVPGRRENVG